MTNHIHLLITPGNEQACSLMMRDLGRDYAAYFNRTYERTGSLWERPFKSCLVDSADYVLACYRYIERNPVRAHMVDHPREYPWSSYAPNACLRVEPLLTPHSEYVALALDSAVRRRVYEQMLGESEEAKFLDEMREATQAGYPLVGERLKYELENKGVRFKAGKPGPQEGSSMDDGANPAQLALIE